MTKPVTYTKKQLDEFRGLREGTGSRNQMERIEARLGLTAFINRVGKAKCDAMFEVLKKEEI